MFIVDLSLHALYTRQYPISFCLICTFQEDITLCARFGGPGAFGVGQQIYRERFIFLLPTKCRRGCGPPSAASDRRPRKVVMQHLDPSNTGKLASCHFVDACCMAFFWRK